MLAMGLLFILGVLSVQVSTNSLATARRQRDLVQAVHLAEAGADMAEAYLRSLSPAPTRDMTYPPSGNTTNLGNGTCRAQILLSTEADGTWLKRYTIIATGTTRTGVSRQVVVQVRQQSFSLYSYFSDQERSSATDDIIWFFARDRIHGPVHTNDQFHISWSKTSADPIFYGTMSSVGPSVDWYDGIAPANTNDWRRIVDGGQAALSTGVSRIAMPQSTSGQQAAAWGSDTGFPATNGIYLPASGTMLNAGIYIRGDCTIAFSVENSTGSQVITIVQGTTTETITVDRANNLTKVKIGSTTTTYYGVPNGVIYTTGNITSMKGTLADNYVEGETIVARNAWTVATDANAGKDVTITDNLSYKTTPDPSKPATHNANLRAASLGVVAEDIVLGSTCPNEMTVNGVMLAGGENTTGGKFTYSQWDSQKRNNLNLVGGIIQKKRGPVSTFNSSNVLQTGYNKNYIYDPRMADNPPPYFPTTGQYDVLSWQYK